MSEKMRGCAATVFACCLGLLSPDGLFAQQVLTPPLPPGPQPVPPGVMRTRHPVHKISALMGATVDLRGGGTAGTIKDFVVNDSGIIEYAVVASGDRNVLVPWDALAFNPRTRTLGVRLTREEYRRVPTFTSDRWPDFSDTGYGQRVRGSFGLGTTSSGPPRAPQSGATRPGDNTAPPRSSTTTSPGTGTSSPAPTSGPTRPPQSGTTRPGDETAPPRSGTGTRPPG